MANIASSKKDARRSAVRAARNRSVKSAVKTKVTKFRRAAVEGPEGLEEVALTATSALDRAASKGVLHKRNAARRKSRLVKRLNEVAGVAEPKQPAPKKAPTRRATKAPAAKKAAAPAKAAGRSTAKSAPKASAKK
jgi:small subunit ribosomal protein S20